jgi:hypothetical protein
LDKDKNSRHHTTRVLHFQRQEGREEEEGKNEVPKPKDTSRMGTITCSNCNLQGHKYTSCLKDLRPDLVIRKDKHVVNILLHNCFAFAHIRLDNCLLI